MDFREVLDTYTTFECDDGPEHDDPAVSVMFSAACVEVPRYFDVTPSLGAEAQSLLEWQRRRDNHYAFYSVFGFGGIVRCMPQLIAEVDDDPELPSRRSSWQCVPRRAQASSCGSSRTGRLGPDATANDVAAAEMCLDELRWKARAAGAPEELWTSDLCRAVLLARYGFGDDILDIMLRD